MGRYKKQDVEMCQVNNWLVVSTPLKNISQIGSSSQLLGKIKKQTTNQIISISFLE